MAFMTTQQRAVLEEQLEKATAVLKWALKSESMARIKAMIELAKSEPGIPVLHHQFDANAWLLNCLNGTIELKNGTIREHRREDLITKLCPIVSDADAICPQWMAFLYDVTAGNQALIDYLQRAGGYSLTGSVEEQCVFFLYGMGQNGKSTFLSTIEAMMSSYAMHAMPELLMVRAHEQHPTERADLFRMRFVVTVEAEQGKRLAESFVKQLTGGDKIRARRMREDFWEFEPTHKIWLAGNHKPLIRGQDHAIWRRIRLIPFTVKIPGEKKDTALPDRLKAELPGILAWTTRGCLEWQRIGLAEPDEVIETTKTYQAEMDTIRQFLRDCCVLKPNRSDVRTKSSVLHEAYCKWSSEYSTPHAFAARLLELSYTKKMGGDGCIYWLGIALMVDGKNGTEG
jgi:putative DNA primase/helicase